MDLSNYFTIDACLASALRRHPSLRCLSMYDANIDYGLSTYSSPSGLHIIIQNPGIERLFCRGEDAEVLKTRYGGRAAELIVHDDGE